MFIRRVFELALTICAASSISLASCSSTAAKFSKAPPFTGGEERFSVKSGNLAASKPAAGEKKPSKSLSAGPLKITVQEAILLTLENNCAFKVERFKPDLRRTSEESGLAAFDPSMTAGITDTRRKVDMNGSDSESSTTSGEADFSQFFPTGTKFGFELSIDRTWSSLGEDYSMRAGLSVTQSLLRGCGSGVNLASLRQAEIDTVSSRYELRGYAESLVAQLETTYWNYALAERQIEIFTDSLKLAEQQLSETSERIKVGKLAETELAAAQAEVALRRQDLIDAKSNLAKTRLQLLRLMNPPGENLWGREVIIETKLTVPHITLDDVETHVQLALHMRPDLNQSKLSLQRGELELVKTKNGLLPKLDLFIAVGKNGYSDSFNNSITQVSQSNSYDFSSGLSFEFPLGNRSAKAAHSRALISNEQAKEALSNLAQLAQVDVRSAYIEVLRAKEQVSASAATRVLQEEKLRAETEKFRVGKSTTFLVAQAQRDFVASQVSEIQEVVNYRKALVELYRFEGSLLDRRGVALPAK